MPAAACSPPSSSCNRSRNLSGKIPKSSHLGFQAYFVTLAQLHRHAIPTTKMAGFGNKKRSMEGKPHRPFKKQRKQKAYHSSDSEDLVGDDFDPVDLLDSDDDIHNAKVVDAADVGDMSDVSSISDEDVPAKILKKSKGAGMTRPQLQDDRVAGSAEEGQEEGEEEDGDDDDEDEDSNDSEAETGGRKKKSKRNDPTAFATSLTKILSTKLSTSKRSDPVLSRSAVAHEASKAAVDSALEARARRRLREQKRQALENGRVKDVLIATTNAATGEPDMLTSEILETERRLRKVAQRGVVKLFNAVRTAQVKAAEAQRSNRKEGIISANHREEKINELSKNGFLELIASGGGGLKKGALEEA